MVSHFMQATAVWCCSLYFPFRQFLLMPLWKGTWKYSEKFPVLGRNMRKIHTSFWVINMIAKHMKKAVALKLVFSHSLWLKSIVLNYFTSEMHLPILFFDIMNYILIFWMKLALKCIFGVWPEAWSLWYTLYCCIGCLFFF